MLAAFSRAGRAYVRGLAQLAFGDSVAAGILVLAGIALVSPWSAVGAIIGAAYGTAVGYFARIYPRAEWEYGLAGFNAALIGILWGGFLASGTWNLSLLPLVLACCTALELLLRRGLRHLALPALALPAVVTAVLASLVFAAPGTWFWLDAVTAPFGTLGVAAAIFCVLAAMTTKSPAAAGWAILLSAGCFTAIWLLGFEPFSFSGLWSITVPLAGFALPAVFLREPLAGMVAGALAALVAALIWLLWTASGLGDAIPPLLIPFILGVWLSIGLMRKLEVWPLLQPAFWRAVGAIDRAAGAGQPVIGLAAGDGGLEIALAGHPTDAGLGGVPSSSAFADERLRNSPRCRKSFWAACNRFRDVARTSAPTAAAAAIAAFEWRGWLQGTISQDVVGHLQGASSANVVDLHGRVDRITCIDCGSSSGWPPGEVWKYCDLRCPDCAGVLKPAITLVGAEPTPSARDAAAATLAGCGVLLVLGPHAVEPATDALLRQVRAGGGTVVFVTDGALSYAIGRDDVVIAATAEHGLPPLAFVLAGLTLLPGRRRRRDRRPPALPETTNCPARR